MAAAGEGKLFECLSSENVKDEDSLLLLHREQGMVVKKERRSPEIRRRKSMEDDFTLSQLSSKSKNTPSPSTPPPFQSLGKRKKFKPAKYMVSPTTQRKLSPPKPKIVVHEQVERSPRSKNSKDATKALDTPVPVKSPALIRAEEVQSSLGLEFPSFIKMLVRSHVSSCFWMGLPVPFCKSFLPREDTTLVLENENEEQYELKYIANKTGLSAGWKKFAVGHNLLEGDVLIFHLIECCKFKVYIIRANGLTEVDGALSLLNLDTETNENNAGENQTDNDHTGSSSLTPMKRKRPKSLPLTAVQKKNKRKLRHPVECTGNESEEVVSEVLEVSRISKPAVEFKDIKSFEEFRIVVDGLCIDSELPEQVRMNYYELCRCSKAFLHDLLRQGLYYKLVAGMIGETVSIANEIRSCKLTTSREDFVAWDNSLESFELLGMKVGFLRNKLRKLLSFVFESEGALDMKKYMEAKTDQSRTQEEIQKCEKKLKELKEASRTFNAVMETLKHKVKRYEDNFQEEVNAPW